MNPSDQDNADNDFPPRVPREPRAMREALGRTNHSKDLRIETSTMRNNQVIEGYRKANREYERSLNDLFGGMTHFVGTQLA